MDLAIHVVGSNPRESEFYGIRCCLEYKISRIRPKHTFFFVFSHYEEIGHGIKIISKQKLLANSLMFSVIEFGLRLRGHEGLAGIVRSKLIMGFEVACVWGAENLLDLEDIECLSLRNNEDLKKYIVTNV